MKPTFFRKILPFLIIIIAIAGAVLTYLFLLKPRIDEIFTPPPHIAAPAPTPEDPAHRRRGMFAISAGNALSPNIPTGETRIRYFDVLEAKLKEYIVHLGTSRELFGTDLHNVIDLRWSPANDNALVMLQPPGDKPSFSLVNVREEELVHLDERIREASWSPNGNKIAYHFRDDEQRISRIVIANPDGTAPENIIDLHLPNVRLYWITEQQILIAQKPSPGLPNLVLLLNLRNRQLTVLANEWHGVSVRPSSDGSNIFVSYAADPEGRSMAAAIISLTADGHQTSPYPSPALAEKCAWSADSRVIYCASPITIPANEDGLPFRYWTGEIWSPNQITKFALNENELSPLADEILSANIIELAVNSAGDTFAFINRIDGRLTIFRP